MTIRPPTFISVCVIAMLIASGVDTLAQGALIGPTVGYEYGVPLTVNRSDGQINIYPFSGNGESANHTAWFGATLELNDLLLRGTSFSPRIALAISTGRFTSETFTFLDTNASARVSTRSFDVYSTLSVAMVDLPVLVHLDRRWSLGIGPWLSWRFSSGFIQTEHLHSPASFTYPDGLRDRTVGAGNSLGSTRLRGGAIVSAGVKMELADGLWIRPEAYGRVDARALLVDSLGIRSASAGISVAVLLDLDRRAEEPIVVAQPPALEPISASISLDVAGDATLPGDATLERFEMPLRPVVRFGSTAASAATLLTRDEAQRFNVDSLARRHADHVQSHALTIVASRMRDRPSSTITLRSIAPDATSQAATIERARAVREHLRTVWNVDTARVAIETSTGTEPLIAILPDRSIAEPIVTRWVTRKYRAPRVELTRSINAPAGLRWWEIVLRQDGRVVDRVSDDPRDSAFHGVLTLDGGIAPVVAELVASDSIGGRVVARDTLFLADHVAAAPITLERRETIVLADESATERVREIAAMIPTGASVDVIAIAHGRATEASATSRLASALLAELDRVGTRIQSMQLNRETPSDADAHYDDPVFAGATRIVVEQPYRPTDN